VTFFARLRFVLGFVPALAIACSHAQCSSRRVVAAPIAIAAPSFPLRLSEDGRYLVDQTGRPFLIQGDAAWSLIAQLSNDGVETYLDDRSRRGFNVIVVNLIEHKFADHAPRDADGQSPFVKAGDFSTPNEAYFAHADWVLRRAREKGIAVLLAPSYLGQHGGDEGWYREMVQNGPEVLRRYGAYVGGRYHAFDNLIWVLGGDFTPPAEGIALVDALADGLRENDPHHLFTAHWDAEDSAQDVALRAKLDLNTTYTYEPVYAKSLADDLRPHALPHFLIESAYELEHDSTPRSLRAQAYYALLTGAVGQVFGNGKIWGFWSWRSALGSDGAVSMTNVRALFEPRAWTSLVPDDRNEVLTGGFEPKGANEYALLARSPDGSLAIAYLPAVRPITIALGHLKTPLRARWYDPTSGAYRDAPGSPLTEAIPATFQPPGTNAAGDPDWVLVLETAS
jgi:hypothetical protein